ncbi:unnamed protein product [Ostreobium quekettii]|uniref:Metal-dependent protein hydrolase n=1 Tax=Ostreobium quekettii TaxID=121088 RepID=A0A8S1IYE0_9CHLO|nr:unnamed protein product [Ostreobium quekettii]|eukprot:evm.model.scf_298.9 EVM.evm.TU.scf_298.9   scf_298:50871-53708(+)
MSSSALHKRKAVKIGTHSGTFHCDEALACWMLKQTDRFRDAEIVRTRDPAVLKDLDVVVDVGGEYDAGLGRFDHHQREFADNFGHGYTTKLSSAGLVYRHFGKEVIGKILGPAVSSDDIDTLYLRIYKTFIEAVDANDNGINQWEGDAPPKYVNNTTLGARVNFLNPNWNEDSSPEVLYKLFMKAVELTGSEFADHVKYSGQSWLPGRQYVQESFDERLNIDSSGEIMQLKRYCPWKEHLYDLEEASGVSGQVKYCLYEDDREHVWRIQAVSVSPGSYISRRRLPNAWRGLRSDELDKVVGIPGCVFVHAGGFIGGHKTCEGVLAMAQKALTME